MNEENRISVTSTDDKENDVTVEVLRPNGKQLRDAQLAYNRVFREALESGALLRQKLEDEMRNQNIWDDEKQKRYEQVNKDILKNERILKGGGIKLSEAKDVAMEMRQKRIEFRELISERSFMDGNTAEGQADNARFNFLASVCIVKEGTSLPYFNDLEEYEKRAGNTFALEAAGQLANMMYGLDSKYEEKLPENKFLRDYKFADKESRLVNKNGHLIDIEGRLISDTGNFVDKDGNLIDIDGHPVDEDGEYIIDQKPFLDNKGKAIPLAVEKEEEEVVAEETPKKTKKTAKTESDT